MIKTIQYTLRFTEGIASSMKHHITITCGSVTGKATVEITETDDGRLGDGSKENPFIGRLLEMADDHEVNLSGPYDARGNFRNLSGAHEYGSPRNLDIEK